MVRAGAGLRIQAVDEELGHVHGHRPPVSQDFARNSAGTGTTKGGYCC